MRFVVVCAIVFFAAAVTCYPGANRKCDGKEGLHLKRRSSSDNIDDGEVEIFRPTYSSRGSPFGHGVIDLDANDDDDDSGFFTGFNFRDLFNDLRKQMEKAQREYQQTLKDLLEKGNTTSTVEVINGHKVIKNETVYEDPNSFVKSVVIHVVPNGDGNTDHTSIDHVTTRTKPKSRPTETFTPEPDTEPIERKKEREPLGESVENEVDDRSEVGTNNNPERLRVWNN